MAAVPAPFDVVLPSKVNTMMLLNACRVAQVNRNYAGVITYDPLDTLTPSGVDMNRMLYAWYRATQGELQTS